MPAKRKNRSIKSKVFNLISAFDGYERIDELRHLPRRNVINILFSLLLSPEDRVKWNAVSAMGMLVNDLAREDLESARIIIRRLMWSLNDESGGIGWGAPEAMGEILFHNPDLAIEYLDILISFVREDGNYLEADKLQQGVLWALGRLAPRYQDKIKSAVQYIEPLLGSKNSTTRGLAVWFMRNLYPSDHPKFEPLKRDWSEFTVFRNGECVHINIGDLLLEKQQSA